METLRIRWTGGEATFEPGTTVRVGRDVDAEVQLRNTNLSRRHAEVVHSTSGWVLRDLGSAQGTWRDGRQVQTVEIRGTVQVTLGREGRGEVLTLEASAAAPLSPVTTQPPARGVFTGPTQIVGAPVLQGSPASGGGGEGTVIVGAAASNRPGGALRAEAIAGATVVTGDALNIECAGRSYSFQPGRDVSIGRDADCEIVSNNPTVSRRHARIAHDGSGWTLRDQGSSGGTFVDGQRITEYRLAGSVAAWLGDATTGERLVVVASGTNPAKARKKKFAKVPLKFAVAGAVAVVAIAVLLVTLSGGGDDGPSNDQLGRATVRLIAGDFGGSGTIIDAKKGLILTNAHVAAPDALGSGARDNQFFSELDTSVREVEVLVAPALDKAAEPRFVAEVVAVDGYLDLAVLKITRTTIGQLIEPGDLDGLVEVHIGDSSKLSTGDAIRVFGYPAVAQTPNATMTDGVVSGPVREDRIGSNRAMLNISADIRHGNSGGLAVNSAGELVGVPTLNRGAGDAASGDVESVASMRPSEFAIDLIDAARSGETYTSPYFRPLGAEAVAEYNLVAPYDSAGIRFECSSGDLTTLNDGAMGFSFTFKGFEASEHQDMKITLFDGETVIGTWTLNREYPVKWPAASGCATVTIPIDTSKVSAEPQFFYTIGLGPNYVKPPVP